MKISVISTTINIPKVIEVYQGLTDEVSVIITGDKKSPDIEIASFCAQFENVTYLDVASQVAMNTKSSELMGWNCIQRRNIALLAALKQRPDLIVTIDDDNFPCGVDYFDHFERILGRPFTGLAARTHGEAMDIGQFFEPPFHHRGFPYDLRESPAELRLSPVNNVKIGVAAGLWLGDPDIDAATRLVNGPVVKDLTEVVRQGVVSTPDTLCVFNSQNTGWVNELAPLMMVWPGVGRYDDIWASYAAQRVMREDGWHVHFGHPLVWQQRNPQYLISNIKAEIFGMETTPRLLNDMEAIDVRGSTIPDRMASLWAGLGQLNYLPEQTRKAGVAWCEDVYQVLS